MSTQISINQYSPQSTSYLLVGIWGHLHRRRRIQLCLLLAVMLASGVAELLSLGAVLPFLAVLSNPERLWQQPFVKSLAAWLGFTQASQLLLPATLVFAVVGVLAALIRLTNLWLNGRLAAAVGSDLSCEAYRRTLYQPFEVHVQRNSAEVITVATTQINQTTTALNALLQLITSAVAAAGLLTGLLLINTPVAIAAAALFGSVYGLLAASARRELRRNSHQIVQASTNQLKSLQEGLGAIRDVLLDGSQPIYLSTYGEADRLKRQLAAKNRFLGAFPRYAIEALGMVSIALLGRLLVLQPDGSESILPILGAFALGAQRLLPTLQQIYGSWATLKNAIAPIQGVLSMISQPLPPEVSVEKPLPFRDSICFTGVYFRYSVEQAEVLHGLSFDIRRGQRIGLIGSTGSGKSTMIDLLMGLLKPTEGKILVDGDDLHDPEHPERLVAWRAAISHVPQNIYLADCSFAENIAFGVPRNQIDMGLVKQASELAQIASYIESTSAGYDTFVGERGIRLSGGQRQRIVIARALYKQSKVLVFDEATSALDIVTEKAVMSALDGISKELTVVMIAHRLSTVESCDWVIKMNQGVIVDQGIPDSVLKRHRIFRQDDTNQ